MGEREETKENRSIKDQTKNTFALQRIQENMWSCQSSSTCPTRDDLQNKDNKKENGKFKIQKRENLYEMLLMSC